MAKRNFPPWLDPADLFEDLDRMRERAMECARTSKAAFLPPADVFETEDGYVIEIDLPGLDRRDVTLEAHQGRLVVAGARPRPVGGAYHCLERDFGPFARRFVLPEDADAEAIQAKFKDGVLTVTIPRRGPVRPDKRRIDLG